MWLDANMRKVQLRRLNNQTVTKMKRLGNKTPEENHTVVETLKHRLKSG